MSLSDVASSHPPCPSPCGSESRFARENEIVGAWQRTTSKVEGADEDDGTGTGDLLDPRSSAGRVEGCVVGNRQ